MSNPRAVAQRLHALLGMELTSHDGRAMAAALQYANRLVYELEVVRVMEQAGPQVPSRKRGPEHVSVVLARALQGVAAKGG